MAVPQVIEVTEQPQDDVAETEKGYEGRRVFIIKTDLPARPSIALNAVDPEDTNRRVPAKGSNYPGLTTCLMTSKSAKRAQDADNVFIVSCDYRTPEGQTTSPGSTGAPNPLDEFADVQESYVEASEPYFLDARPAGSGGPQYVTNSAGDPFENAPDRETAMLVLTITLNEPTHNRAVAYGYKYTINDRPVVIDGITYDTHTLLLKPIIAKKMTAQVPDPLPEDPNRTVDLTYWQKTYSIKWNPDGWLSYFLDVGFRELVPDPTATEADPKPPKLQSIVEATNQPVKKPVPLNGEGRALRWPLNGEIPNIILLDPELASLWKAAELEFWPYPEKDWSDLAFTWPDVYQA